MGKAIGNVLFLMAVIIFTPICYIASCFESLVWNDEWHIYSKVETLFRNIYIVTQAVLILPFAVITVFLKMSHDYLKWMVKGK